MPIESPIVDLSSLNEEWPLDTELQKFTDDHLRLTKDALKKSFTDLSSAGGVVTVSATELNHLDGASSNIQSQLDNINVAWIYTDQATYSPNPGDRLLVDPPVGGSIVTLPTGGAATEGGEIQVMDASGLASAPNNTLRVRSGGSDVIINITTGQFAVTNVFFENGQHYYFIRIGIVWYAWAVSGFTT